MYICEDKFGARKTSFSWLGQKENKKIDTYGHDANHSELTCAHGNGTTPRPGKTSQHCSVF